MELDKISKIKGVYRKSKRIGRGFGSGKGGHTVGRGNKGQKARGGFNIPQGFEGGQVPLHKRLPKKRGFRNALSKDIISLNLPTLNIFDNNTKVNPNSLYEKNIIKYIPRYGVKILGHGKIEKKLILEGFIYSEKAKYKIEKSGSEIKN